MNQRNLKFIVQLLAVRGFMNIKILLSLIAFTMMFGVFGQNNSAIDSLNNVLKTAIADTAKVNCLNALSSEYRKISDNEMAMQNAESALELAKTLDYKKGIAISYKHIGAYYGLQGNYPEALNNYFTSLKIFEEIGDKKGIGYSYDNIGIVNANMGNYPEAIRNYLTSLKIFEEIGDKKGMSYSYNSLGNIYELQDDYQEAMKNHLASLKISEEIGAKEGIVKSYNNIGNTYLNQGDDAKALVSFFTALKIYKEIRDKVGIAGANTNIGYAYYNHGNYHEANKYLQASLKISEEIGHEGLILTNYELLGDVNTELNNLQDARKYLDDGLALSRKFGNKLRIMYNYESLSWLDRTEGNFEQALEYYEMYTIYKDSLWNQESKNQIALIKTQYETERKDREIDLLNNDKALQEQKLEKQKLLRNGMFAGTFLIVLIGLLVFRSFRLRKKLEKQQAIVQERHRISADLHDDVGSGLSKITLLSELLKTQAKTPENRREAEKISETALELSSTISEIIWALNSNNDYLENMLAYIRRYAAEYFEDSPTKLKVVTQGKILPTPINGEHRRNIFYSVKEALNNIMKHAQATEAELKFVVINDKLDVIISDNGKGLPDGNLNRFGNGINNMRNRMKSISGDFKIESQHGTRVILELTI